MGLKPQAALGPGDDFDQGGDDADFGDPCDQAAQAEHEGILGLIAGEVRGWEFGSQPCGWVFAVVGTSSLGRSGHVCGIPQSRFPAYSLIRAPGTRILGRRPSSCRWAR